MLFHVESERLRYSAYTAPPPGKHHTTSIAPARSNLIFLSRRRGITPNLTPPNRPELRLTPPLTRTSISQAFHRDICTNRLLSQLMVTNALNDLMLCVHLRG
ncbi:hypothetical protein CKAH01_02504 [Colletotrichum kahawae]|uniref:Uncharacterized protein n=1 Tax=Colletotrichum kahawae TaxID=34407 RepID=A0AAD9XXP7_COLKA|nr:hypothetical protein CKAH01_02504 [Colletotrichum kahawae]